MQHPPKKQIKSRANRRVLLVITGFFLALAAAFVLLIPRIRTAFPASKPHAHAPVQQRIFEVTEPERLQSVTITPEGGECYTLRMQDGRLMLETEKGFQDLSDVYAEELLEVVTHIVGQGVAAEDRTEVADQLAVMGLETPRATAVIRYTDGSESTLSVGAGVPNTTYAYCVWSGSPAVYLCDAGVAEALTMTRNQLLPVEQPVIYAGLLDEVMLENASGRCLLRFTDGAYGTMQEPYVYPLDAEAAARILTALDNFRLGTLEGEAKAEHGFSDPLCVVTLTQSAGVTSEVDENGEFVTRLVDAQSLRFTIGRAEGDFFYTCEYEGSCYLISRFLAEALVEADPAALLSRRPADAGDLALRSVRIEKDGRAADIQIARTERVLPNNELETDAEGNVVYDTFVTVNGKARSAEWLDEMVSRLDALNVSGEAPANFVPQGDARWRIVLKTENGLVRVVEAWKMDLFADVIAVDGVMLHCVHAEAIDRITEGLI